MLVDMPNTRILSAAAVITALLSSSASAELTGLLDGCTLELTVQQESCTVVHFYRCVGELIGDKRILYIDRDGPETLLVHDEDGAWIEVHKLRDGEIRKPVDSTEDHFSLGALREQHQDDWNFRITNGGIGWGAFSRYEGSMKILDEPFIVDSVSLSVAEMQAKQWFEPSENSPPVVVTGQQYIDLDHGRILGFRDTTTLRGVVINSLSSLPIEILL